MRLLTEEQIAGVCGRFARPENKKEGLHLLAEMAAEAEHKETLKAVKEAINDYTHDKISFERLAELLEISLYELDVAFRKRDTETRKVTLMAVGERLKKVLGSYFVLAYVGEDEPYAPTIEPKTVQEFVKAFERGEMPEEEK